MSISDAASILYLAEFGSRMISRLRKKKRKSKTAPRRRKQTKEEILITKLLTNPEQAIKEMGAEYVVKNRKKIIRNIVKRIGDEF